MPARATAIGSMASCFSPAGTGGGAAPSGVEGRGGGDVFRGVAFLGATGAGEDTTFTSGSGSGLASVWGTGGRLGLKTAPHRGHLTGWPTCWLDRPNLPLQLGQAIIDCTCEVSSIDNRAAATPGACGQSIGRKVTGQRGTGRPQPLGLVG